MNYLAGGSIIMLLCDLTDIWVSLFKTVDAIYSTRRSLPIYAMMIISWIYLRLYHYPMLLLVPVYREWESAEHFVLKKTIPLFFGFLVLLHILNMFWFVLMVKGALKRAISASLRTIKSK